MRKTLIRTISTLEAELADLDSKRVVNQPTYKPLLKEHTYSSHSSSSSTGSSGSIRSSSNSIRSSSNSVRSSITGSSDSVRSSVSVSSGSGSNSSSNNSSNSRYNANASNNAPKVSNSKKDGLEKKAEEDDDSISCLTDDEDDEEDSSEEDSEEYDYPDDIKQEDGKPVDKLNDHNNPALSKSQVIPDEQYIKKVVFVQKYARRWLAFRAYRDLVLFYDERAKIVKELVTHEVAYVLSLQYLCTYFIAVLREEYKGESFIQTLFKTLETIRQLHSNWLKMLQERVNLWNVRLEIGDVLRELIPCLDNYNFFCSNYLHLIHWIKEQAKAAHFAKQEKRCCEELQRNTGVATNLQILLSLPLTNLRQYNSILEELANWTHKGTKEYTALIKTLDKIKEVAALAKSSVKNIENKHKVLAVQQSFINGNPPIIAVPNRVLLHEGALVKLCRKTTKKRYFWIFNDILVYGTMIGPKQFKYHRNMPLVNSKFVDLPDDPSRQPFAFQVVTANKSFIVFAHDKLEKAVWLKSHARAAEMINKRGSVIKPKQDTQSLAPVWQHDNMSNNCLLCGCVFSVVKRRHHCRKCGKLVCGQCSPKKMVLENIGKVKRVCVYCYKDNLQTK